MSLLTAFILGLIGGMVITGLIVWWVMPSLMLDVYKSGLAFEDTVKTLKKAAEDRGWKVPKIHNIQDSLGKAGYENMTKLKIIAMCQPDYAYDILQYDENKKVSGIMPCSIGIYEDSRGEVYVSGMNIGLMSRMFGGTIAEVMGKVGAEEHKIIEEVSK